MRKLFRFSLLLLLVFPVFALEYGDIVFNEFMWMGSSISGFDEYIELRNMTGEDIDFADENLEIFFNDSLMFTIDNGELEAWSYFLISRLEAPVSQVGIEPDFIEPELFLPNSGSCYYIYSSETLLDRADDCLGQMASGRYVTSTRWWSMERNNPPGDGSSADRWHHGCLQVNWNPGARERGTPGAVNYKNIPPTPPDSLSISNKHPTDNESITVHAFGVNDYDDLPMPVKCFFDWYCDGIYVFTDTDSIGPDYSSELSETFTEPGEFWSAKIMLYDDVDSIGHFYSDTAFVHWEEQGLVVSEIMWMGSSRHSRGEWVELHNFSGKDMDFDKTPITIYSSNVYGVPKKQLTLSGVLLTDSVYIFAGSSQDVCKLEFVPDTIIYSFDIPDLHVGFRIYDNPDTINATVLDNAGDFGRALAGKISTMDSVFCSMSRTYPIGDGTLADSWHNPAYSSGFVENAIDRGTPFYVNPMGNSLPILEEVPVLFSPEAGTRDTMFEFQIVYSDEDGHAPEYVNLVADLDGDGDMDDSKPMIASGTDYRAGVLYSVSLDSIAPQDDLPFCFHANDGYVRTVLGIPPFLGPDIELTMGLSISQDIWFTDTIVEQDFLIGPGWNVVNTGDIAYEIGLEISLDDSIEYVGFGMDALGGLLAVDNPSLVDVNAYCLSALFQRDSLQPIYSQFNSSGTEDVVSTSKKFADSLSFVDEWNFNSYILDPKDTVFLFFRFDSPIATIGPRSWNPHIISLRLWTKPHLE